MSCMEDHALRELIRIVIKKVYMSHVLVGRHKQSTLSFIAKTKQKTTLKDTKRVARVKNNVCKRQEKEIGKNISKWQGINMTLS